MRVMKFSLSTLRQQEYKKSFLTARLRLTLSHFKHESANVFNSFYLNQGAFLWEGICKVHNRDAQL